MTLKEEYKRREIEREAKKQKQPRVGIFRSIVEPNFIIQFLLVICTGALAYIAWRTDHTLNNTMVAASRPWVTVAIEPAGPLTWENGGLQIHYKITTRNIGKTPALAVKRTEIVVLEKNADILEAIADWGKFTELYKGRVNIYGNANILPDDGRSIIIKHHVDKTEIEKWARPWDGINGPKLITPVLAGTVHYRTQFDSEIRHTDFVFEVGFWDPAKGITVVALDPAVDGNIPQERVRIRRHPHIDGNVD
jgi:hypothetical protein